MNFSPTCQYPFQKTNTGKNSLSYIDCTIWNENISSTTQIKLIYLWRPQNITNFVTSHPTMTPHLQKRLLHLLFKTIESSSTLILNWKIQNHTSAEGKKETLKFVNWEECLCHNRCENLLETLIQHYYFNYFIQWRWSKTWKASAKYISNI